jgi:hypothetical protein
MNKFSSLMKYPYGKYWTNLTDVEKQAVAKEILLKSFDEIEVRPLKRTRAPLKVIYFNSVS